VGFHHPLQTNNEQNTARPHRKGEHSSSQISVIGPGALFAFKQPELADFPDVVAER
jgi:hypothetical protein